MQQNKTCRNNTLTMGKITARFFPLFLSRLRPAKPDFERELDDRLAARRAMRAARSDAARRGWASRRSAGA